MDPRNISAADIPDTWKISRAKYVFPERDKRGFPDETVLAASQSRGMIPQSELENRATQALKGLDNFKLVCPGDFVISLRSFQGGFEFSNRRGICSPAYTVMKPLSTVSASYYRYYLKSAEFISRIEAVSSGIRDGKTIRYEDFGNLEIPVPSDEEGNAIAAFLDYETARIDRLIEKQQRLIELLREKRQAVISHTVTKGLDTGAPMKDSGVEWLGEVPAHWKITRVKWVAKLESGHTPSKTVPEYWEDCDIPWVSLNDSKKLAVSDYIDDTAHKINRLGLANSSAHILPSKAVVFTRDATIGLAAITTKPMAVSQHLIAWVCSRELISEYLLLIFYAMEQELQRATFGATIKTIGMPEVRRMVTTLPPLSEQREIVEVVFEQKRRLHDASQKAHLMIKRLREHRAALISAAVTGKIDVRDWQPPQSTNETEERGDQLLQAAEERAQYSA